MEIFRYDLLPYFFFFCPKTVMMKIVAQRFYMHKLKMDLGGFSAYSEFVFSLTTAYFHVCTKYTSMHLP